MAQLALATPDLAVHLLKLLLLIITFGRSFQELRPKQLMRSWPGSEDRVVDEASPASIFKRQTPCWKCSNLLPYRKS